MSKASRDKGARGERELARILTEAGFASTRNARNGLSTDDIAHCLPDTHVECKWSETLCIPAWWTQTMRDASGRVPVIAFRQSHQPWRVVTLLDHYLDLRKHELRDSME